MKDDPHYIAISNYYGGRSAKRSGVLLMNHIDEGLIILDAIGTDLPTKQAYVLHPIYQIEEHPEEHCDEEILNVVPVHLAKEYKLTANAYLSQHFHSEDDKIALSRFYQVNHMLIADKVQNRKDFELYHKDTHPKSDILDSYFKNWLRRLGISEEEYRHLKSLLTTVNK